MEPLHQDPKESATEVRPGPEASGSAGSQAAPPDTTGQAVVRVVQPLTLDQNNLGAALGEFSDVRSPYIAALAVAAYRDAERYRVAVMDRWEQAEREKDEVKTAFYGEKEKWS